MNLSENRFTGTILMAGTVLGLLMYLFRPGGLLNNPVGVSTPLVEKVQVLADAGLWTHATNLMAIMSLVMILFALWSIRRPAGRGTAADAMVRLGLWCIAFAFIAGLAARGMNHVIVHTLLHLEDPMLKEAATLTAVNLELVKTGIRIGTSFVGTFGVLLMALGLAPRLDGAYRVIALTVGVLGVVALITLVIADHFHDLSRLYRIVNLFGIVMLAWYFILGLEIYRGHSAVTPPFEEE